MNKGFVLIWLSTVGNSLPHRRECTRNVDINDEVLMPNYHTTFFA